MVENNQSISKLQDLLDYDVRQFTCAEIELKKSLLKWANETASVKLKNALQKYVDFIQEHVEKLEVFIEEEKITSINLTNHIMMAFIEEAEEKLSNCTHAEVKDACLVACIQMINHFKISAYGTAASFAKALGLEKQAAVFHEAEVNEKQIDDRLSQLAEHEINEKARTPIVITR